MNPKIVIAFASGAVLASGIVFFAVRQDFESRAAPRPAAVSRPSPTKATAAAVVQPVIEEAPTPPAPKSPVHVPAKAHLSATPIHEKPSPLAPHARQAEQALVAINQPTLVREQPVAPPPVTAPPVDAQVPVQQPEPTTPPPPPPSPAPPIQQSSAPPPDSNPPPTVTIPAGTIIPARIGETINASHYLAGDTFVATLDRQLVVDGWVIAQRGARLEGRVVQSSTGNGSHLEIELTKLSLDDGQHIHIHTQSFTKNGSGSTGGDVAKVGAGAAIGAAIGALAGGGKGAAIGAGIGTVAGVAGAAATHAKPAEIPVESRINFRITDPVTVTERLN